jgi:L-malate glycosyltransferase
VRILFFSDNSSDHNRRFIEKLSAFGHEIWFLDASSDRVPEGWLPPGLRYVSHRVLVPRGSDPSFYEEFLPEFKSLLKELQPDLIHAGPIQGCAYVAALSGFHPLVVTSWGSDLLLDANRDARWKEATAIALRAADGFMCDCNTVRKAARSFVSIPDSKIAQFPWGIKSGTFSPVGPLPPRESFLSEREAFRFICTRSWESLYGIDVLLEAFRRAYGENRTLRLILLGTGSLAGSVHDFIARHELQKVVVTPGRFSATEVASWFRAANGYVSCAQSDGTSVSLLEAMATGLPVLVTDIPSNREWVSAGENGWLATTGSAEDFAGKLLRIASLQRSELEVISQRNQKIVAARADWDRNFFTLLDLYERLVKVKVAEPA